MGSIHFDKELTGQFNCANFDSGHNFSFQQDLERLRKISSTPTAQNSKITVFNMNLPSVRRTTPQRFRLQHLLLPLANTHVNEEKQIRQLQSER